MPNAHCPDFLICLRLIIITCILKCICIKCSVFFFFKFFFNIVIVNIILF